MHLDDPVFPPLLNGVAAAKGIMPADFAFDQAQKAALGAGDLVWARSVDIARCAVVLEPEVSCEKALAMVPLAMVATGDSIGAIAPPNVAITFAWPKTIYANGAKVGSVDLRFPNGAKRDEVPKFAVLSLEIYVRWPSGGKTHNGELSASSTSTGFINGELGEPGDNLNQTVLYEEGCGELDRTQIMESWARHFLAWVDTWEQDGFKSVHENWLFRAKDRNQSVVIEVGNVSHEGELAGLDEDGGILLKNDKAMTLIPLADLWFSPQAQEPKQ